MIISLHDSNLSRVCYIDNSLPDAMHYSDDSWNRYLQEATSTFDFKIYKTGNKYESFLNEKNYVSFSYGNSQYLFSIMRTEEDESSIKIYAENLNLELLNETKQPIDITTSNNLVWYLNVNYLIEGSGITIGINEVSDQTRKIKLESEQTGLARLISIANNFGAEIEFVTSLNPDGTLKSLVANFYKKYDEINYQGVGRDRQDVILEYGKNIESITRTVDKTDIFNTIVPVGKDGVGIESIEQTEYDDKGNIEFYTKAGNRAIYAPISKQLYKAHLANGKDGWIQRYHTLDGTSDVSTLYTLGLNELRKHAYPAVTYDVKGFFDLNIGDTVRVFDNAFSPILLLKARVAQQTISFSNPSQNKTTFGNIQALENRLSKDITSRLAQLVEEATPYRFEIVSSYGLTFKNSTGQTTLTARVFKGAKVDEVSVDKFEWTINGTKFGGTSKSQIVKSSDINGTAVVRYNATIGGSVVGGLEVTIQDISDGKNGDKGDTGDGISKIDSKWQITASSTKPSDSWSSTNWETDLQIATATLKYLWQIDRTTFTSGKTSDVTTLSGVYGDNGSPGKNGLDSLYINISNPAVTVQSSYDGSVQSYSGTGTRIDLTEGATVLQYDEKGVTAGTWKVSAVVTGITCGAIVDSGAYATVANHSGMTTDSAMIEYTITGKRSNGANFDIKASQSFSKSKQGIVGVSSYTWIRYSANSNGTSMTTQPGADTKYIGLYTGASATPPTNNIDYTWSNYVGPKGDPTGVTKQATEPASAQRFLGMLWQYTGTTSMSITGTTATPNAIYRWTGTAWELWYFYAANIQADAAFFNLLNVSSATVDNLGVNGAINANLINPTAGNLLINSEFQSNNYFDGWKFAGSLGNYFKDESRLYGPGSGDGSTLIFFDSRSSSASASDYGIMYQDYRASSGFSYSASCIAFFTSGSGYIRLRISALDSSGIAIGTSYSTNYTTANFGLLKLENFLAPSGTVSVRIAIMGYGASRAAFTRLMMNKGSKVAPYTPSAGALTVTGDMVVDGAIKAKKMSVDTLSTISSDIGTMIAGIIKVMADIIINAAGKTKKFGMLFTKKGLLSTGPTFDTAGQASDTKMAVASLTQGELRFINMDYNDNLEQVQDSGTSSANNGFIRFSSTAEKGDLLEITSSNILLNGYATQTSPWITLSTLAKYRVAFGTVTVAVGLINGSSSNTIYLGSIPVKLRPGDSRMFGVSAWWEDTSRDRHVQVNADQGNMSLLNPYPNQEYRFEVTWTIPM